MLITFFRSESPCIIDFGSRSNLPTARMQKKHFVETSRPRHASYAANRFVAATSCLVRTAAATSRLRLF